MAYVIGGLIGFILGTILFVCVGILLFAIQSATGKPVGFNAEALADEWFQNGTNAAFDKAVVALYKAFADGEFYLNHDSLDEAFRQNIVLFYDDEDAYVDWEKKCAEHFEAKAKDEDAI